jgi:hypothetical protein
VCRADHRRPALSGSEVLGVRLIALILVAGGIWDFFTTFIGVAKFFDLAMDAKINPAQFTFAMVVTLVIFGFVIASHLIWSLKSDDIPSLLLKAAWFICVVIDFLTSWYGTASYVFSDIDDARQAGGLLLVTFLILMSSILLSKLLLAKDVRGKPFLF